MLAWLAGHPDHMPQPVTVRKGHVVRLNWGEGYLRIDSDVYFPPKKAATVEVSLQKKTLRVVLPPLKG